jgi:uncharacterized protein YdiU (UPF0061 family)
MRRYRYGAQPEVAHWNLMQLGSALLPLTDDTEAMQTALDAYATTYREGFRRMMAERLGWGEVRDGDDELVNQLFATLVRTETDQVIFFRQLALVPTSDAATDEQLLAPLHDAWYTPEELAGDGDLRAAFLEWLRAWGRRTVDGGVADDERRRRMDALNPKYVLRNYLAQEAIDAAEQGDSSLIWELLDVLRRPYDVQPGRERFAAKRPEWARVRVGCSMLSCSS